jgi:hypothetical protein
MILIRAMIFSEEPSMKNLNDVSQIETHLTSMSEIAFNFH